MNRFPPIERPTQIRLNRPSPKPRKTFGTAFAIALIGASFGPMSTVAAEATAEAGNEFFEKRVRPILVERCHECHSGDVTESELSLDTREQLLVGGMRGPSIVPHDPHKSLLIVAVNHADTLHMPPKQKIPSREIADLTEWVRMGAPWPNDGASPTRSKKAPNNKSFLEDELNFWAFKHPRPQPLPHTKDQTWSQTPIDQFVLAKIEASNLAPASPATRRALIRRLTLDMTGMLPTAEEIDDFGGSPSPDSVERLVDRLLASPRYGERWGRRWLDVARYADSNGLDENLAYAAAFRYRDYVIAAFNKDKPYDRFLREQVAGDLIASDLTASDSTSGGLDAVPGDPDGWNECQTATGFLCVGAKMLAEDDPVKMQMDIIDEQVDTLGQAVLGVTFGCARCHDHKFDPIRIEDYYALAGIFKATKTMDTYTVVARWREQPLGTPDQLKRLADHRENITRTRRDLDRLIEVASHERMREARRHVGDYLLAASEAKLLAGLAERAAPTGDQQLKSPDPAAIQIEAEDFTRGNVRKDFDSYGQGIGVLVNQGSTPNFVEYDLELPKAGLYQLELRYAAAAARPCKLLINGHEEKTGAAGNVTGSWNTDTQTWFVEGLFPLAAGKLCLRLEHPQNFPHIDKLLLTPTLLPNDFAAEILIAVRHMSYRPIPELVQQWSSYLNGLKKDDPSPFSPWLRFVSGEKEWQADPQTAEFCRRLGTEFRTLSDLSAGYSRAFTSIMDEWEAVLASDAASQTKSLADPLSESLRAVIYDPQGPFAKPKSLESHFAIETKNLLKPLRDEIMQLEKSIPKLPEVMAVTDTPADNLRVHIRGSHTTLGDEVARGFPRIFGNSAIPVSSSPIGRRQLAQWLTDDNPLTARVMVNRIWLGHFSTGIVRSPDNFGKLGERPTHPDLLDWLALRFVDSGWSMKATHRLMVLSSTYQLSTECDDSVLEVDPANQLYSHANRRRLEAEEIRDVLLQLGEGLDLSMGGSLLPTENRQYVTSTANVNPVVYNSRRRSIYLPIVRSAVYEVFNSFDFPDPSTLHGIRESTTVASQALFMMNSLLVADQTKALAQRLLAGDESHEVRAEMAFLEILGRKPNANDCRRFLALQQQLEQSLGTTVAVESERRLRAWQIACRTLVASNEFLYVE